MTDEELRSTLRTWHAPPAPAALRARVFHHRKSIVGWLFSGEVRVPVPVALAVLCLLFFIAYRAVRPPASSLSDFEHVQQWQPRVVRTTHETP